MLHSCLLLIAGAGTAVLRASLVELPREVEHEGATGWIVAGELAIAKYDGIGLVGVEEVYAAQVGRQRAETMQVEVLLDTEATNDARFVDAEIIVFTLCGPFQVGTEAEGMGQLEGVAPRAVEPRLAEGGDFACGGWRLVVLEHGYHRPYGMPAADGWAR